MKILHVTEAWNGGIATYLNTLISAQLENKKISKVSLLYSQEQTKYDFDKSFLENLGVDLIPYSSSRNPARIPQVCKEIARRINQIEPDVIHAHSSFPGLYVRACRTNIPVVYCAHGWSFVQESGYAKKNIYAAVEKLLARKTDMIIHISEHEKTMAREKGLKARNERVVYNAVRDTHYSSQTPLILPHSRKLKIGFIGRKDYKKGFDRLSDLIKDPEISGLAEFYIFGDTCRDENALSDLDQPNVHDFGWIDNKIIDDILRQLDVVLIPSRQEGFGLVALEAMRNSVPVMATSVGGLPEIIIDGKTGYLINPDNFYEELKDKLSGLSREKCREMGAAGRKVYSSKFGVSRFEKQLFDCYQDVLLA
jgi:glycosyltransferase involved in cell wall biosynthesis